MDFNNQLHSNIRLMRQFPDAHGTLWKDESKRLTFLNYVLHFFRKNPGRLRDMLIRNVNDIHMRTKALKLLDDFVLFNQGS